MFEADRHLSLSESDEFGRRHPVIFLRYIFTLLFHLILGLERCILPKDLDIALYLSNSARKEITLQTASVRLL